MQEIFDLVDEDKSGTLEFEEFKAFFHDEEGNKKFRQVMQEIKEANPQLLNMPTTFSAVLEYILVKAKHKTIQARIQPSTDVEPDLVPQDIENFCQLLNQKFIERQEKNIF